MQRYNFFSTFPRNILMIISVAKYDGRDLVAAVSVKKRSLYFSLFLKKRLEVIEIKSIFVANINFNGIE